MMVSIRMIKKKIVIAADNDHRKENNPGLLAAITAAEKHDCQIADPEDISGSDFNDLQIEKGVTAVTAQLKQVKQNLKIDMKKEVDEEIRQADQEPKKKKTMNIKDYILVEGGSLVKNVQEFEKVILFYEDISTFNNHVNMI